MSAFVIVQAFTCFGRWDTSELISISEDVGIQLREETRVNSTNIGKQNKNSVLDLCHIIIAACLFELNDLISVESLSPSYSSTLIVWSIQTSTSQTVL